MAKVLAPSFDNDPKRKGSYRRAVDDIYHALELLKVGNMEPVEAFLFYYLACEKLAKIMKGVCEKKTYKEVFRKGEGTPYPKDIKRYLKKMNCAFVEKEIGMIFRSRGKPASARNLRDRLIHEFGPSHARKVAHRAHELVPMMRNFLQCRKAVVDYLGNIDK